MATSTKTKPAFEIRYGLIKATVWRKQTSFGMRHNVKFVRLFKDGDQWRESNEFGRDDLPLVAKVADKCHDWIFENGNGNGSGDEAAEEDG